jgi:hypothetical protein
MTHGSGLPNRVLMDQYRQCLSSFPGDCQLLISHLAYAGPVDPHVTFDQIPKKKIDTALTKLAKHKKNFISSFRQIQERDLIVSGFFLIIKKPL